MGMIAVALIVDYCLQPFLILEFFVDERNEDEGIVITCKKIVMGKDLRGNQFLCFVFLILGNGFLFLFLLFVDVVFGF